MATLNHEAPTTPGAAVRPARASRPYRRYVLVLLTAVYTFNFLDRQIMSILAPAIQEDLGLSDSQLGVLIGLAFALLYTTLGIPIARLADRANRVTFISVSLGLWSAFTAICGVAQNFTQLALARVGVGIGEAGGTPPAHSLISDLYPKEKRAGALATYALGIPIGVTLAYLAGGWVLQNFDWRTAFIVLGLPGVALAVLLRLTVTEPARGGAETTRAADQFAGGKAFDLKAMLAAGRHLFSIPTYLGILAGHTAVSFASYAKSGFVVVFFARSHPDMARLEVLFWLGVITGTAYVAGVILGGRLVDRLATRNKSAYGTIPAIALVAQIPFFLGAMWTDSAAWSLILWWPVYLLNGFFHGPCFALAQTLAPVSIRALSTAIYFFVLNLIALGFGPTAVGLVSDLLAGSFNMTSELSLRIALTLTLVPVALSLVAFLSVARNVKADWARATGDSA